MLKTSNKSENESIICLPYPSSPVYTPNLRTLGKALLLRLSGGFLRGKGEWMPLVFSFEGGMGILFFSTKRHSWSVHTPGYIPRWIWDEAAKEWNVIYRISAGKFQRIAIAPCGIYEPGWRKGLILRGHAVTLLHTLRYLRIRYQKHCNMSGCTKG